MSSTNTNENIEYGLFSLGTQVQAGLDEHNESIIHKQVWKDKLDRYALINDTPNIETDTNITLKFKSKPKPKRTVKKAKKHDLKNNDDLKDTEIRNKQRKFGSINKEIIRKFKNNNDINLPNDMKLLYEKNDWNTIHDLILSSIKSNDDTNTDNFGIKDNVIFGYTDFGQLSQTLLQSQLKTQVPESQIVPKLSSQVSVQEEPQKELQLQTQSQRKIERLTQESSSHPVNFTANDLTALYDISLNENNHMNVINTLDKTNVEETANEEVDDKQRSGIFTLSQVLGERNDDINKDNNNNNNNNNDDSNNNNNNNNNNNIDTLNRSEIVEIEDSCGSELENNDEITTKYIEHLKNGKTKNDLFKNGNISDEDNYGTQNLPIELKDGDDMNKVHNESFVIEINSNDIDDICLDFSNNIGHKILDNNDDKNNISNDPKLNPDDIVNIIEIPNSSDDENDYDKSTTISQHLRMKNENIVEHSIIELSNSSFKETENDGDDDEIIITKRGNTLPSNVYEPDSEQTNKSFSETINELNNDVGEEVDITKSRDTQTSNVHKPIDDSNNLDEKNETIATNLQLEMVPLVKQKDMIIPTSSPISSQEIDNFEPQPTTSIMITNSTFDDITTIPNSSDEEEEMVFMTALSQPVKIDERLKYFDGWTLSKLKKQLNLWGIKKCSSMSKKTIDHLIEEVVESISVEKWEWGVKNNKKGECIDFSKWSDDANNPDMLYITQDGTRNEVYRKVHEIMKWDNEMRYDVLRLKPININKIIARVNLNNHCRKIEKKLICEVLDKLGVCWTDSD